MKVGYRRVSTVEQKFDRQELGELDKLFEEKVSGSNAERLALNEMIDFVRQDDEVVVYSIDRLARNLRDLQSIIQKLNDKGATIQFLSERLTFSASSDDAFAKLQLQMMGAFAEFERNIIRKRQAEGIAKAKARGVYAKRGASINKERVKQLQANGLTITAIAREMDLSRMSIYRINKQD
jgi:DNA invertase Pin-like site-specific DNA recombinase